MKRVLTLIPIVGIFTTGILISVPESASAYCVYNKAAFPVDGVDTRRRGGSLDKKWEHLGMKQGERGCCPGNKSECQGATIRVTGDRDSSCEARVDDRGWIVVHSKADQNGITLQCNVNEPI